jgi:hypothetical protein
LLAADAAGLAHQGPGGAIDLRRVGEFEVDAEGSCSCRVCVSRPGRPD